MRSLQGRRIDLAAAETVMLVRLKVKDRQNLKQVDTELCGEHVLSGFEATSGYTFKVIKY